MFERFRTAVRNRQRRKWEKKRRHGKRAFILYRGVLKWGGIMFILTACTNVFVRHQKLDWLYVASRLPACLLAGYLWGRCTWFLNERRFGFKAER